MGTGTSSNSRRSAALRLEKGESQAFSIHHSMRGSLNNRPRALGNRSIAKVARRILLRGRQSWPSSQLAKEFAVSPEGNTFSGRIRWLAGSGGPSHPRPSRMLFKRARCAVTLPGRQATNPTKQAISARAGSLRTDGVAFSNRRPSITRGLGLQAFAGKHQFFHCHITAALGSQCRSGIFHGHDAAESPFLDRRTCFI